MDMLLWTHHSNLNVSAIMALYHEAIYTVIVQSVEVQINFLPIGHTHEDVDQLFSKIDEIK